MCGEKCLHFAFAVPFHTCEFDLMECNTKYSEEMFIVIHNFHSISLIQLSTISFKLGFSRAAATLSLSLICLLTRKDE